MSWHVIQVSSRNPNRQPSLPLPTNLVEPTHYMTVSSYLDLRRYPERTFPSTYRITTSAGIFRIETRKSTRDHGLPFDKNTAPVSDAHQPACNLALWLVFRDLIRSSKALHLCRFSSDPEEALNASAKLLNFHLHRFGPV